jgi:hypothetical protein
VVVTGLVEHRRDRFGGRGRSLLTVTADSPPGLRSTRTPLTPSRFASPPATACTHCSHVIPLTRYVAVVICSASAVAVRT